MEIHIKDGDDVKIVTTPTNTGKKAVKELVEAGHADTDENGTVVVDVGSINRIREATMGHLVAGLPHLADVGKFCEEEYSPYPKEDKPKRRARNNWEAKAVASEKKRQKRIKRKKQARRSQKRNRK